MKTNMKTPLAICVLGFIGLININAIADNKKAVNNEAVNENMEMLTLEPPMTDEDFFNTAKEITALEADMQIEKYATKQIQLNEIAIAKSDFLSSAESITASGSDVEIEKYVKKLVVLNKIKNSKK